MTDLKTILTESKVCVAINIETISRLCFNVVYNGRTYMCDLCNNGDLINIYYRGKYRIGQIFNFDNQIKTFNDNKNDMTNITDLIWKYIMASYNQSNRCIF